MSDHWPQCYTALLAGGGVKGGYTYGESDELAKFPARNPVKPEDLAATIFELLGIDPATEKPVYLKIGPYGPYVQLGDEGENGKKPKRTSLLKGMQPEDVDLELALRLLDLPRANP